MKKLLLIYWTGTFNTRYVTDLISKRFEKDYQVTQIEVTSNTNKNIKLDEYDLIGIGYPIYGFNIPGFFERFLKKLKWKKGTQVFIYKNSGETLHANDASSYKIVNFLRRKKVNVDNEYHFIMPYNIHFRYEDKLVNEMLRMDDKLLEILHFEITNNIKNIKKYKFKHKLVTFFVGIIHIGGFVNSFFYRIKKDKCIECGLCVKSCPMNNVYLTKNGKIKFHHKCEMCMRCSFFCPTDAIRIGYINMWRVNGKYDLSSIKKMNVESQIINDETKGHFHCYIETYKYINTRFEEINKSKNF